MQHSAHVKGYSPRVGDHSVSKSQTSQPSGNDVLVIEVCDEGRKLRKEFVCPRDKILHSMHYFSAYLSDASFGSSLALQEISVHCDIQVFEWLLNHIMNPNSPPALDAANVMSILVSSEFLQMDHVFKICLEYLRTNMNQVLRLPLDLSCLSPAVLQSLSSVFSLQELDSVCDRKDRLVSKLYICKIEALFQEPQNELHRCIHCQAIYTEAQKNLVMCRMATAKVNYHGDFLARHTPADDFALQEYIISLRNQLPSWKAVFWRLWGMTRTFQCTKCHRFFAATNYNHCAYHTSSSVFAANDVFGSYPCCRGVAMRFSASVQSGGCKAESHCVSQDSQDLSDLELLLKHETFITTEFDVDLYINDICMDNSGIAEAISHLSMAEPVDDDGDSEDLQGVFQNSADRRDIRPGFERRRYFSPQVSLASQKWVKLDDDRTDDAQRMESIIQLMLVQRKDLRRRQQQQQQQQQQQNITSNGSNRVVLPDSSKRTEPSPLARGGSVRDRLYDKASRSSSATK